MDKLVKIDEAIRFFEELIPFARTKERRTFVDTTFACGLTFNEHGDFLEDESWGIEDARKLGLEWKIGEKN